MMARAQRCRERADAVRADAARRRAGFERVRTALIDIAEKRAADLDPRPPTPEIRPDAKD